ncbi:MAG: nucleotidyltransferase [Firmicutes bacterium]|nr:nucleotidyltransferase [Bacillota bacterium]
MNTGIIAEYNPFHNGHKYHISQTKRITDAENIIVVMSGNFVQRGEPAIVNKYLRTKAALLNGADMVIELPTVYSTGSADVFAYGSISLLNSSGIIDNISFGSETGDTKPFLSAADILCKEPLSFKSALKEELSSGISYPKARTNALSKQLGTDCSYLSSANNILALEYIKALMTLNSHIKPYTIARISASYHSEDITGSISSASAVRKAISELSFDELKKTLSLCIPDNYLNSLLSEISSYRPTLDSYSDILSYILCTKPPEYISSIADVTEGLENRIKNNYTSSDITTLLSALKTKRYALSKLRRAILHIILSIKKTDVSLSSPPPYIRVLGIRKDKSYLLSLLAKHSSLPIVTNVAKDINTLSPYAAEFLLNEAKFSDMYYLFARKQGTDFTSPLVVV